MIPRSVLLVGLLLLCPLPAAASGDGTTRSATAQTSSYLGSTTLPRPLLKLTQRNLTPRATEYTATGHTLAAFKNVVTTTTVCQYDQPGREVGVHLVHEFRDEALIAPDPRSEVTFSVALAERATGPWRSVLVFVVPYNGTLDPTMRRTIHLESWVSTEARKRVKKQFLRVRTSARLEGNLVSFKDTLRIVC